MQHSASHRTSLISRVTLPVLAALLLAGCRHHTSPAPPPPPVTQAAADEPCCCSSTMCEVPAVTGAAIDAAPEAAEVKPSLLPVTLSNGTVDVTVDPAKGRITGYGFHKGRNVLWINDRAEEFAPQVGGYCNWGGDKLWVWPQTWAWPPPFPEEHWNLKVGKLTIRMTSPLIPALGARLVRTVDLAQRGTVVTITNRLEPVAPQFGPEVALWSITQVPATAHVLAHSSAAAGGVRVKSEGGFEVQKMSASTARLEQTGVPGKASLDADCLVAAYNDVAFIQRDLSSAPAIGIMDSASRAQVQSHWDRGADTPGDLPRFVELEFTSASSPLLTAGDIELKVQWSLAELESRDHSPRKLLMLMED